MHSIVFCPTIVYDNEALNQEKECFKKDITIMTRVLVTADLGLKLDKVYLQVIFVVNLIDLIKVLHFIIINFFL